MKDVYENPLVERYSSSEMLYNFSPKKKFTTWRKLWLILAEAQRELGINISKEQIEKLRNNLEKIDFKKVKDYEKKFHHDVMAHIYAFGDLAPDARSIIHIGATSSFVVDNTDLIQIRDGLNIILDKIINLIFNLKKFVVKYKYIPTLGFTHYQPAQLTTVGRRAVLWIQSLIFDLKELEFRLKNLNFRGVKGAIGNASSFKILFNNKYLKFKDLNKKICESFGFKKTFLVTGQTYDRKIDSQILNLMSNIAQSSHKFTNDIRLLQNLKEVEEKFEISQIGSSAMVYKHNPIISERISSLAKYVISISQSSSIVSATQWLERTLDDSANKRLVIPHSFLSIDAILMLYNNVISNLNVYPKIIEKHVEEQFPFILTENFIIDNCFNKQYNIDLTNINESIRKHSNECINKMKTEGSDNDLLERINNDKNLKITKNFFKKKYHAKDFIGFSIEQIEEFLSEEVNPILNKYNKLIRK